MSNEVDYDKLLLSIETEDQTGVMCICTGYNEQNEEQLYAVSIEKKGDKYDDYTMLEWHAISLSSLTDNYNNYNTMNPSLVSSPYREKTIYYCLFKNPRLNEININNETIIDISKFSVTLNGKSYTLGFWFYVLPNGESLNFKK